MARLNAFFYSFLLICLLASSVGGKSTEVTYCDKTVNHDVKVGGVDITPNPVTRGAVATFSISATASKIITGGEVVTDLYYYGMHMHIHTETHVLCSETICPILAGDFVLIHNQVIQGFLPPGPYTMKVKVIDGNSNELTCIEFPFNLGFRYESDLATM